MKPLIIVYFRLANTSRSQARKKGYPIEFNTNKLAQVFIFARIFYIAYKLKHLRFQLTRNENCKEHLDQTSVCLDSLPRVGSGAL